jgi:hypothetical protein
MKLTTFLLKADIATLVVEVVCLLVFAFVAFKNKQINSSFLCLSVIVAKNIFTLFFVFHVLSIPYKGSGNEEAINFSWFVGFWTLDILAILSFMGLHYKYKMDYGSIYRYMVRAYFVLSLIHLTRYAELYFLGLESDFLKPAYKVSVTSVNYSTTLITAVLALLAVSSLYTSKLTSPMKLFGRPLKWTF